jgi:hypothetical protein
MNSIRLSQNAAQGASAAIAASVPMIAFHLVKFKTVKFKRKDRKEEESPKNAKRRLILIGKR